MSHCEADGAVNIPTTGTLNAIVHIHIVVVVDVDQLKGTKVDGVYTADPIKVPDAKKLDKLTYLEVLSKDLGVMDASAISLARENNIPVIVFSIKRPGAFAELMQGRGEYTIVTEKEAKHG